MAVAERTATWWSSFKDAQLDSLVAEVLWRNYDLAAVAASLDAAAARARIAGADVWPTLDLGLSGARRKQNFIGLPIGPPGGGGAVLSTTSNSFGLSASSAWELDLWGRIRAGKRGALADVQAAAADLEAARLSLAAMTAKAWFGASEALLQVRLAQTTSDSYGRTGDWVRDRYDRGLRSSLDLRLALANAASAAATTALREQLLDVATRQLEIILGRYPAAAIALQDSLFPVPPPVPAGLPSTLLLRRPDLIAAERRLVAADARLAEAWRAQFPRLGLTGSAGTSSSELADLLDNDFSVWSVAGNLLQPLFQGGRLRAGVDLAAAGVKQAAAAYASRLLQAFAEVESALAAEQLLARREHQQAIAAEQSVAARQLAEDRYHAGLEPYVTVLEAQRRGLVAESLLLAIRRQRLDARVNLHLALGGGFVAGEELLGDALPQPSTAAPALTQVVEHHEVEEE